MVFITRLHIDTRFYWKFVIISDNQIFKYIETAIGMSGLAAVKIKPVSIVKPLAGSVASIRMKCHQMILVYRLDRICQRIPDRHIGIASIPVTPDYPNDIGIIFIAVCQKTAITGNIPFIKDNGADSPLFINFITPGRQQSHI